MCGGGGLVLLGILWVGFVCSPNPNRSEEDGRADARRRSLIGEVGSFFRIFCCLCHGYVRGVGGDVRSSYC